MGSPIFYHQNDRFLLELFSLKGVRYKGYVKKYREKTIISPHRAIPEINHLKIGSKYNNPITIVITLMKIVGESAYQTPHGFSTQCKQLSFNLFVTNTNLVDNQCL